MADGAQPGGWPSRGVLSVGLTSFFSDAGHEIATAVLPSFLTSTLHASASALGLIEGISDALTGVTKLLGGPLANEPAIRVGRPLSTLGCQGDGARRGAEERRDRSSELIAPDHPVYGG